jgi:ATP-binding cassette subfamily C protein
VSGTIGIAGDAMIALPPGPMPLRVLDGAVEVYLVGPDRRRLVALVPKGRHVFPLGADGPHRLVLAASAPATLAPDDTDLDDSARGWTALHGGLETLPEGTARLVGRLQQWTLALAGRFADDAAERDRRTSARLAAREGGDGGDDAMAAELRWLAERAGGESGMAPAALAGATWETLPARARFAGLRLREVTLAPDWPRRDGGPLILRARTGGIVAAHWHRDGYRRSDGGRIGAGESRDYDRGALVLFLPFDRPARGMAGLARFVARDLLFGIGTRAGAGLGFALVGLALPVATGLIVDDFLPAGNAGLLAAAAIALVTIALFSTLLEATWSLAETRINGRGALRLAAALGDHVLRLPAAFFRTIPAGDFNQRLESVETMRGLLVEALLGATLTGLMAIAYFGLLFTYDSRLALIGLALTLVYAGAVALSRWLQMTHLRRAAVLDGRLASLTYEMLESIVKLRSAAAEGRALARWSDLYSRERLTTARGERIGNHFAAFSGGYEIAALIALFAAAVLSTPERLSAGMFLAFLAGFGLFEVAFMRLCDQLLALYGAQPLAERAEPILAALPETAGGRADPGRLGGAIDASGLLFGYDPGAAPLLDDLSFRVAPGEHLAIVGASGSGKSTILRLLLGFETARAGSITYDGQELAHLDPSRLRGQIGVVLQSSLLFAGSILENIRGASGAGLEQCLEAAAAAGLEPDIRAMGMGIHTPITEGGGTFSGGQKQRILIARALAAKPRILFLDEATSALDNATQAVVTATLDRLAATRITIAHRLSTVRRADRIGVLKHGRFVESGTFEELMALDGEFALLARRQLLEN